MRVAQVQELGGIGSVELRERPDPTPAAGQAVVRVRGAGVGPWDVAMISGAFGRPALPYIPGFEVAGVVEAVGDGVEVRMTGRHRQRRRAPWGVSLAGRDHPRT